MTITTRLYTALFGTCVGKDTQGNRYYTRKNKRWVVYNGKAEPSRVPPEWHGWLHYTTRDLPSVSLIRPWQKEAQPNLTGTLGAYLPPGHLSGAAQTPHSTAEYQAWKP